MIYFFLLLSATFSFRIVLSAFFHPHFPIRTCHSQVSVPRFTDTLYEQNRLSCGHFQTLCLLQIHEVRVVCDLFSLLSQSGATLLMRQIDCHKRTKEETKASPIHPRTLFVLRYIFWTTPTKSDRTYDFSHGVFDLQNVNGVVPMSRIELYYDLQN